MSQKNKDDPERRAKHSGSLKTDSLGESVEAHPTTPPAGQQDRTRADEYRRASAALRAMPTSELMTAKAKWPYGDLNAWFRLLDDFAELNGLQRTRTGFTLADVARASRNGGGSIENDAIFSRPERDHCNHFKCDGRAAALVSEPYHADIPRLRHDLEQHDLALHVPPNPRASFWYPGHTLFLVITCPETPINWPPYQLEFELEGEDE